MNLDDLPEQLQELFDRARAGLDAQIAKGRTTVDSLNAEKAAVQNALTDLQAQLKQVQTDLDSARAHLDKASTARQLDSEIKKSRSELERLKGETAAEEKTLVVLTKKRVETEARVVALENSARLATAERCRAQEIIEQCKKRLEAAAA